MGRYDGDQYDGQSGTSRQRDIILASNEYAYVISKTNGQIRTYTGPITMTTSAQEALVLFNKVTKRFEETTDFNKARQLFVSAPEGWYIALKNPTKDNTYPEAAKAVNSPDLWIGKKINISGPCSFSLFPGQMAKVIQGHRLRSNQYLLARVYDAESANKTLPLVEVATEEGETVETKVEQPRYTVGQLLVIKGTEVSFYIPPTGIEVIPVGGSGDTYIRDAVTLERLEYAILKDEDGEKRYVHGPAVVFPKPTEVFVESPKGGNIFRALELSPISGIYVKVIAEYADKDGTQHPIGEELFITGNDQMIYYPRPEHAMIQYDGKYMHHAIAIPKGEGRYILNRLTGEIKTIKGPQMYLPDPRYEVVVKRKLTEKECELYYPGNEEVKAYNAQLSERSMERKANKGALLDAIDCSYSTANQLDTLAIFEANANISRGVSYTKPRTITLDTKYDGVVGINVWTGYAINVVSKGGKREVVVGPATRLLDYDETLEYMTLSTGRPKTTDNLLQTAYLRVENNKISDLINVQTKDYVDVQIKLSYCVNFREEYKDKWFSVENYVKFMCDRMRSMLKKEIRKYDIQKFYAESTDIVRNLILTVDEKENKHKTRLFKENGMEIVDVEVLSVAVESSIASMIEKHQNEIISKNLELADSEAKLKVVTALAEKERATAKLNAETRLYKQSLEKDLSIKELETEELVKEKERAAEKASNQAKLDVQTILNKINDEKLANTKKNQQNEIEYQTRLAKVKEAEQKAYAETIASIMNSVSPDLIAALTSNANASMLETVAKSMSPYAIAKDSSVADVTNELLRGTPLDGVLKDIVQKNN